MSLLLFSFDPSSITSLGITLMLMLMGFIYYYFYSNSSSSATKKEKSSSEPKILVSTSSSSVQKSFKHDVFLSFRGEDTRNDFVCHLYNALKQKGIQTYIDDEKIERGETIDTQLKEAIEDSRFFIIVFSKDYAGSSWCLDELVKIMKCERTAYPVFYDVEPTEIRNQSGAVEKAFKKHENKEAAEKWRKALKEAATLAGWESKKIANGNKFKLIQIIVDKIFEKIRSSSPSVDRKLVGMETRIEAVLSSLELDAHDVRMIGIWGMGGGGKTTLARAVFDRISHQFEGSSFVDKVREVSNNPLSGLKELQKQILNDIFSDQNITVSSDSGGKNEMAQMMHRKKVLVVLDDVDSTEQLEALAGEPDWFKLGSRVIITTREKQVLLAHGVKFINDVSLLSPTEAICLLSKYAFKKDIPNEGYEQLSKEVVKYADGLPLTITVLGSLLCDQSVPEWEDNLERLKKIPLKKTMDKLELSYINLEKDHKEIFLDVVCMLKGWEKENAIRALESCGFFARIGLRVLERKSLITISEGGYLGMHDHIEEMGRNIVRRLNPNQPERHSRLWIREEIEDIMANNSGTQATECIRLIAHGLNCKILKNGLANMKKLRFLYVDSPYVTNFDEDSLHLPNALRFLRWSGYPFSSLPKTFQPKNLVELEMNQSKMMQLWKDGEGKPFLKLRFLKFTFSYLRTLDLSVAPNLETLILEDCYGLVEVHFQVTPNLKELRIYSCYNLEKLHMPSECPKLRSLDLCDLKLRTLHLGVTPNLETLRVGDCADLVELQIPAECPKLITLDICDLRKLRTLHIPAECPKLVNLNLRKLKLRTIHLGVTPNLKTSFKKLRFLRFRVSHYLRTLDLNVAPNLETLILEDCYDLVEVHFQATPNLKELRIYYCTRLEKLHLGVTPNLETLRVDCADLVELQIPAESPKLRSLDLCFLKKLRTLHLGVTPNLETLRVINCADLVELQIPAECPKLITLDIRNLRKLRTLHIPAECPKLVNLDLRYCIVVKELPEEIGRLECLKELDITGTGISRLPESIFRVKGLRIVGSRRLLESCGFTSEIKTSDYKTFCYI